MFTRTMFVSVIVMALAALTVRADSHAPDPALAIGFKEANLQWGGCPPFMPEGCALAVLHGDPSKPNLDVFFKVLGGSVIPEHWHTSAERMVLVSGEMEVTYRGQEPKTLKPGMYAYGPPKAPHKAHCKKGPPCVLFIAFESPLDAVPMEEAAK